MTVPSGLLEHLVAALADELAARVVLPAPAASDAEPWRLLTLAETCDRLGRSERRVREWVRRGELAHVRLDGGALAFDLDDVKAFAHARRVGADPPAAPTERPLRAVSRGWLER